MNTLCPLERPEIVVNSHDETNERHLLWLMPSSSLAMAFRDILAAEASGLDCDLDPLTGDDWAVRTSYGPEHVSTVIFAIYLVAKLDARQRHLNTVLELDLDDD